MRPDFLISSTQRNLRACLVCSIVLPSTKFLQHGCPNCESVLNLSDSTESVQACTSAVYEGLIALVDPAHSWVARWQRLDSYVPGLYAVKVVGRLDEETLQNLQDAGVKYIPRDGTAAEYDA